MKYKRQYKEIIAFCRSHGIKVRLYEAISSNSVYMKLDEGVLYTIRISDHNGKKKLKYRYNLIKDSPTGMVVDEDFTRYYFNMRDIGLLFDRILEDRQTKLETIGSRKYMELMESNIEKNKDVYGFWTKAEPVQDYFSLGWFATEELFEMGY